MTFLKSRKNIEELADEIKHLSVEDYYTLFAIMDLSLDKLRTLKDMLHKLHLDKKGVQSKVHDDTMWH